MKLGETIEDAVRRELEEETRVRCGTLTFVDFHNIIMRDDDGVVERHYVLAVFAGHAERGLAIAGDDAAAVGWYTLEELEGLSLTGHSRPFIKRSAFVLDQLATSK